MTRDEFLKRFPQASESTIAKNCADGVAPIAEPQRSVGDESVAEASRENPSPAKCFVRLESFRCKLIDGDNLHGKAFVDALQTAGAIYSDAPGWCKVEVSQTKVEHPWEQKTLITITELDS